MADTYQVVLGALAVVIMVLSRSAASCCGTCWPVAGTRALRRCASGERWRRSTAGPACTAPGRRAPRSSGSPPTCVGCGRWSRTDAHRSAAHQMGNRLAYDRVLIQACSMLEIEHELDADSTGLDRDIERFRVEAELERAGVMLTDRRYGQAA